MSVDPAADLKFVAGAGISLTLRKYTENGRVFRNWKFERIKGKVVEETKEKSRTRESRKERKKKEGGRRKKEGERKKENVKMVGSKSPLARRKKQLRVEEEELREMAEEARLESKEAIESEARTFKNRRRTLPSQEVDSSLSEKRKARKGERKSSECDLDQEMSMEELRKKYREMALKVEALEKADSARIQAGQRQEVSEAVGELNHTLTLLNFKYNVLHHIAGFDAKGMDQLTQLQEMTDAFSRMHS